MTRSAEASSAAEEYKLTLAELTSNNKTQINLLTILADDYKPHAEAIVNAIQEHILAVPSPQKLLVLYVCDSILKNVKDENYAKLFSRIIVNIFTNVFKTGNEKVRSAMYKLRLTWSDIFMPSRLYELDMKVNAVDSAWPVANPQTGRALRGDPLVVVPPPAAPQSASVSTSNTKVHVNPKFIQQQGATQPTKSASGNVGPKPVAPSQSLVRPNPLLKPSVAKAMAQASAKPPIVKKEVVKKEPEPDVLDKIGLKSVKTKDEPSTSTSSGGQWVVPASSKRKIEEINGGPPPAPRNSTLTAGFEKRKRSPIHEVPQDMDLRPSVPIIKPTQALGAHAFAQPPQMRPTNNSPPPFVPPFNGPPPGQMHPMPPVSSAYGMPFAQPPSSGQPFRMPPPPPNAPTGMPSHSAPAIHPSVAHLPKPIITSEAVKLDIPQNNRIFVDQKSYEVVFVGEYPVIERAGLPHKVYFSGPPRNVIVDGVPYMLSFGETKTIYIDDYPHQIRFGAPSRELYMGEHPFKGQFGGPPIAMKIGQKVHEVRLTGSAPEVKIEPDPSYDLIPLLNKMRASEKKQEVKPAAPDVPDPFDLLKKLQRSGYLKPATMPRPMEQPPRKHFERKKAQIVEEAPSADRVEIERRATPSSLQEFNMRLLKIRYDSVVGDLLRKRDDACRHCGLRMDGMPKGSEAWMKHMEWHVKRNLSQQENVKKNPWYPSDTMWPKFKPEEEEENKNGESPSDSSNRGVIAVKAETEECAICGEKFVADYDDEVEEWRFRDSVQVQGKTVHTSCAADVTIHEEASTSSAATATTNMASSEEPMDDGESLTSFELRQVKYEFDAESQDAMSTISVIVEANSCAWGRMASIHGRHSIEVVLRAIVSFCNSHLAISASNQVLVFAYARGLHKKLLFNSTRSSDRDSSATILAGFRAALVADAESDNIEVGSSLAPAMAHAICHMKRREAVLNTSDEQQTPLATTEASNNEKNGADPNIRAVVIGMTSFFGSEHVSLMNIFFSAAKQSICVDVVSLGDDATGGVLHQAADITGGLFLHASRPINLLQLLMTHVLGDPSLRKIFPQPTLSAVDYRASCACHHQLVSTGWVCSVCLSVLCQFMPICKVCNAVFKNHALAEEDGETKEERIIVVFFFAASE
ncbi:unnamed protein product [Caenorhabditis auriculariae]|uniref:General transcription factor IIH subunit 3 n=1 Tax=Caenorhabditis auriculariae TaxID=2777116 RepID=A0A8S1GSD9_9PELO|nr:unnamed protein product [Caenorhabditis auriculariae]